jgi:hypothetical protein
MLIEIPLALSLSPFAVPPLPLLGEDDVDAADLELLPATAYARFVSADLLAVHAHDLVNASHAARCVACHGVRSHPVPVALVGECSRSCGSLVMALVV